MDLLASDVVPLPTNDTARNADEIDTKVVEVVCMTIENFQQSAFLAIEEPITLVHKESLQKEKQISVDPISLSRDVSSRLMLPPIITGPKVTAGMYPPLSPAKPKFLSSSLPNSATSSPRFGSMMLKKKWRNQSPASPHQVNTLACQHSAVHSLLTLQRVSQLRRSKSCGEGRACAPSDDFDLCLNGIEDENRQNGRLSISEAKKEEQQSVKDMEAYEEGFKCGALCLFLPGFGKGKPVRARKEENAISRTVSLERFECGSWSSSAIMNENELDGESVNLYFDLPMELIRSSINDAHSPIAAAFVFDKDRKGVLKNARSTARKSHESSRHVRFSTSTPTSHPASPSSCITPRLRKAREEFNAFLEAQSA